MTIALIAALAMVCQDVLGVCMVDAEARDHGWLAGILDSGMWLFALASYHFSLNALDSHNTSQKVLVIGLVTAANLFGSKLGEMIGHRYIHALPMPVEHAVAELETRVAALEERA